jgi:hypothetical protein
MLACLCGLSTNKSTHGPTDKPQEGAATAAVAKSAGVASAPTPFHPEAHNRQRDRKAVRLDSGTLSLGLRGLVRFKALGEWGDSADPLLGARQGGKGSFRPRKLVALTARRRGSGERDPAARKARALSALTDARIESQPALCSIEADQDVQGRRKAIAVVRRALSKLVSKAQGVQSAPVQWQSEREGDRWRTQRANLMPPFNSLPTHSPLSLAAAVSASRAHLNWCPLPSILSLALPAARSIQSVSSVSRDRRTGRRSATERRGKAHSLCKLPDSFCLLHCPTCLAASLAPSAD